MAIKHLDAYGHYIIDPFFVALELNNWTFMFRSVYFLTFLPSLDGRKQPFLLLSIIIAFVSFQGRLSFFKKLVFWVPT